MSNVPNLPEEASARAFPASEEHISGWLRMVLRAKSGRLSHALLVTAFFAVAAAVRPAHVLMRWTGFEEGASAALFLVIVAATLWVTEAVPLFVTSFIILFFELAWLSPILLSGEVAINSAAFTAPFFSNVILLFLGGFALSVAYRKYSLDRWIARWVLKKTKGRPRAVVGAVIAVTAFLSMWMSNTATAAMMLGLALPLLEKVNREDPIQRALPLAVALGANLGGMGTPIGTPPNAIVMEALNAQGATIGFATWMLMAVPLLVVVLVAGWWLLLRLYPPQIQCLEVAQFEPVELSHSSWAVLGVTAVTGVLWLTGDFHSLSTGTVALIPVVVFFGFKILDAQDFQNLPWNVLFLAGGGLSLGVAVQRSGLGEAIVSSLPVASLGQMGILIAIALVAALMTTFMSNTATANLLVPVVAGLSGVELAPLLVVVAFTCSATMILPVSTPPNAMVFSSGTLSTRDLVRSGFLVSGLALVLTVFGGPTWWAQLGL